MNDMIFAKERIEVIVNQLKKQMYRNEFKIVQWQVKKGNYINPEAAENAPCEWKSFDSEKDHWYGPDEHYWFKAYVSVPETMSLEKLVLN
ncbi:MAG: hypothetical protein PHX54_14565, partial [Lentimicrobiaceae bacterium]|nr:hypothetical protein [Lentimicrobiaceae bacterium]